MEGRHLYGLGQVPGIPDPFVITLGVQRVIPGLQDQHLAPLLRQPGGQGAAPGTRADNDEVIALVGHLRITSG